MFPGFGAFLGMIRRIRRVPRRTYETAVAAPTLAANRSPIWGSQKNCRDACVADPDFPQPVRCRVGGHFVVGSGNVETCVSSSSSFSLHNLTDTLHRRRRVGVVSAVCGVFGVCGLHHVE